MIDTERRTRRRPLLGVVTGLFVALCLAYAVLVALLGALGGAGGSHLGRAVGGGQIGVISISGIISTGGEPSLFGAATGGADRTVRLIREAEREDAVKAVVIRLNTPGGTPAAAQEIFEAILAARQRKPFIASLGDLAASGGYYVAAACDRIVADRATATGSIGVILPGYDLSGLYDWIHVRPETIKSGKFKDTGSGNRPLSAEERTLLQDLVDNTYQQFVDDVCRGRNLTREALLPHADGRLFTGEQALAAGLIDVLGGFWDAVRLAEEKAGLPPSDTPNLCRFPRGSLLDQLLQSRAPSAPPLALSSAETIAQLARLSPLWLLAVGPRPAAVAAP